MIGLFFTPLLFSPFFWLVDDNSLLGIFRFYTRLFRLAFGYSDRNCICESIQLFMKSLNIKHCLRATLEDLSSIFQRKPCSSLIIFMNVMQPSLESDVRRIDGSPVMMIRSKLKGLIRERNAMGSRLKLNDKNKRWSFQNHL